MRRYRETTTTIKVYEGSDCDGCGRDLDTLEFNATTETGPARTHEVIISVDEDSADGKLDIYEYCDTCFTAWIPLLKAAGSTAPNVTGEPVTDPAA